MTVCGKFLIHNSFYPMIAHYIQVIEIGNRDHWSEKQNNEGAKILPQTVIYGEDKVRIILGKSFSTCFWYKHRFNPVIAANIFSRSTFSVSSAYRLIVDYG